MFDEVNSAQAPAGWLESLTRSKAEIAVGRAVPHIMAEMEALAALPDAAIDLTEMPEAKGWRNQDRGLWHRIARLEAAVPLEPDLLDWFRTYGLTGEDWRARVTRALLEYVAKAEREAA